MKDEFYFLRKAVAQGSGTSPNKVKFYFELSTDEKAQVEDLHIWEPTENAYVLEERPGALVQTSQIAHPVLVTSDLYMQTILLLQEEFRKR